MKFVKAILVSRGGNNNFDEDEINGLADDFESEYGKGNSWKDSRFRIMPFPAWSGQGELSPATPIFIFPIQPWENFKRMFGNEYPMG